MPKLEVIEEELPLGAKPKFVCDENIVIAFVTPSKQVASMGPGNKEFECPLLKNITKAEIPKLRADVLKALPNAHSMRIMRSSEGIGVCAMATDPSYKRAVPTRVDLKTVGGDVTHRRLWEVTRDQADYVSGQDTQNHSKPDCSSGCRYFFPLEGKNGSDWGVCTEPRSPRAGLLTFEHMGCEFFEEDPEHQGESPPPKKAKPVKKGAEGGVA